MCDTGTNDYISYLRIATPILTAEALVVYINSRSYHLQVHLVSMIVELIFIVVVKYGTGVTFEE